jgi:HPt (histidine-containing phosphotransfer) domain-containing protein
MTSLIEPDRLAGLRALSPGDGGQFFRRVVTAFRGQLESIPAEIRQAHERSDRDSVARLAHSLKGSAGNLGAPSLIDLCKRLEKAAQSEEVDCTELVAEVEALAARVLEELDAVTVP